MERRLGNNEPTRPDSPTVKIGEQEFQLTVSQLGVLRAVGLAEIISSCEILYVFDSPFSGGDLSTAIYSQNVTL